MATKSVKKKLRKATNDFRKKYPKLYLDFAIKCLMLAQRTLNGNN